MKETFTKLIINPLILIQTYDTHNSTKNILQFYKISHTISLRKRYDTTKTSEEKQFNNTKKLNNKTKYETFQNVDLAIE